MNICCALVQDDWLFKWFTKFYTKKWVLYLVLVEINLLLIKILDSDYGTFCVHIFFRWFCTFTSSGVPVCILLQSELTHEKMNAALKACFLILFYPRSQQYQPHFQYFKSSPVWKVYFYTIFGLIGPWDFVVIKLVYLSLNLISRHCFNWPKWGFELAQTEAWKKGSSTPIKFALNSCVHRFFLFYYRSKYLFGTGNEIWNAKKT